MDKGTQQDWIEDLQQQVNSLHEENRRLRQDREQWQSLAERFCKFSAGSGLASNLFAEMDELLNRETGRD
jgi:hypothetical protein